MVGYDARLYSKILYDALIEGLTAAGKKVLGIGLVSTPQLHFCQIKHKVPAAIMVTASHNPPPYHGFKFFDDQGGSISYDKGLKDVKTILNRMLATGPLPAPVGLDDKQRARYQEVDKLNDYLEFLTSVDAAGKHFLKVAVDISNGSSGRVLDELGARRGINIE
jgi:phosphomannomutase/phosphoglucomutase